jgi:hypothetical protein
MVLRKIYSVSTSIAINAEKYLGGLLGQRTLSFLKVDVINMATQRCYLTMFYKTSEKASRTFVVGKSVACLRASVWVGIISRSMRRCELRVALPIQ